MDHIWRRRASFLVANNASDDIHQRPMSHTKVILYSSLSNTAIIALSIIFAVLICPVLQRNIRHLVIAFLVALGAGCLAGDAIFHLMPHALNPRISIRYFHIHPEPHADGIVLWRSMVIVCSIYVFYLFHLLTHSIGGGHSHMEAPESVHHKDESSEHKHDEDSTDSCISNSSKHDNGQRTLIVMLLVGDVIHSFNDGMAIGGAFSKSASDGLSTSLAVLFHEVPHVVGNFAILVSRKLSIKTSLTYQGFALSSMYVGSVIGSLLGTTLNLTDWIFAVTAGMFLFVALAEMIPELLHSTSTITENLKCVLFLQNAGLIVGIGIMALLATFEERIKKALT